MKTSNSFLHKFNREEIQKGIIMDGRYLVNYDSEDNRVFDVYINVGDDLVYNPITLDRELPYHEDGVYQACEQHLAEGL